MNVVQLKIAMERAAANQDWQEVARLDLNLRDELDGYLHNLPAEGVADAHAELSELLTCYRAMLGRLREQQQQIRGEVVRIDQAKRGAMAYLKQNAR